jgi:hypothetical protein
MSPRDISEEYERYRNALEQIERMKRTPRAYRHTKFGDLIKIAQDALRIEESKDTRATHHYAPNSSSKIRQHWLRNHSPTLGQAGRLMQLQPDRL